MIGELHIRNFKSIRSIDLEPRRVNLLIGGPNTGKSNILEALGLLSATAFGRYQQFVRFESLSNLFYDDVLDNPIEISGIRVLSGGQGKDFKFTLMFHNDAFEGSIWQGNRQHPAFTGNYQQILLHAGLGEFYFIKSYRYHDRSDFPSLQAGHLWPPDGDNLFSLIKAHIVMRERIADLLNAFNLKPTLRVKEHKIELLKQIDPLVITYPYTTASDTVKRMIFFLAAIETNKDSTIVLEEPESNTFPFYTKDLAERIGRDTQNQYFISTHNPYFFETVVQKTPTADLAVFLTYMRNYETHVRHLTGSDISELLDGEPFFNLDAILNKPLGE